MRKILILSAVLSAFPLVASAQDNSAMSGMSSETVALPKACNDAAGSMDMSKMTDGMEGMMSSGSNEVVKANMDAMMKTAEPMMKAMSIEDADLAFNCSMIVHHQGAIAMSQVELKMGKDESSRKMAQKIIDDQKKEIAQMTDWVGKHAAK